LTLGHFASIDILNGLGFFVAGTGLLLIVVFGAESDQLFWKSELEWWDEDDTRFEDWRRGI
jgi:hypothetical protein